MCTLSKSFLLAIALGSMLFAVGPSYAATETFVKPKQGGNRLDWCLDWATGCGAPAANAWCQSKGFDKAASFSKAHDIGASQPTRLITSGAVCDQAYCDGFQQITCETAGSTTFVKPKQGANRLDWCLNWGQGCGAEAANAWCNAKGFAGGASSFSIAADIGAATPTRLISTGAVCDQGYCDGFAKITCEQ
jgi:hypothetical protein